MSVTTTPPISSTFAPQQPVQTVASSRRSLYGGMTFDYFQKQRLQAPSTLDTKEKNRISSSDAAMLSSFEQAGATQSKPEDPYLQVKMYKEIKSSLDAHGQQDLDMLMQKGALTKTDTDDQRSTLSHLYAILTTPRAQGLNNRILLRDTVELLAEPYLITQKIGPLSEPAAQQILQLRNQPGLNRTGLRRPNKQITWQDLNVTNSATCVASSVMTYMAYRKPGEFARHVNELTSPMLAFHEKATFAEISPENPAQALDILSQNQVPYTITGNDEVTLRIGVEPTTLIRAVDAQNTPAGSKTRSAVETMVQSGYMKVGVAATPNGYYDDAIDARNVDEGGAGEKGLTEQEKTFMEKIIKDNGGVKSVTYQVVDGKLNPQQGEESNAYLYGYTRTFEQTLNDIKQALDMGEFVIIGITQTDETGAIVGGHEITIMDIQPDPQTGELQFVVADSDDDTPSLVYRSVREIIPRIHHAGLPVAVADRIEQEQKTLETQAPNQYWLPDQNDTARFDLPVLQDSRQKPPVQPDPQQLAQPQPVPQQQVEWVPVPVYGQPTPMTIHPQTQPQAFVPGAANPFKPGGQAAIPTSLPAYAPNNLMSVAPAASSATPAA